MIRTALVGAGGRARLFVLQALDRLGIPEPSEEESDNENAGSPWYSQIYRRFSFKFGRNLPFVILCALLSFLFFVAVMAKMNELEMTLEPAGHHLRGTNSTTSAPQTASSSIKKEKLDTSSSLPFTVLVSILFWVAVLQVCRYIQRAAALRSLNETGAVTRQREAVQILAHLMQAGRGGPGAVALSNRLRMALLDRDFTGEDYEMLQGLDDSPRSRRGASQEQIDQLPLHTVTEREVEEQAQLAGGGSPCSICLGPFEVGEEVRTVPCLHKFHKECIDTWLRDRAVCPVCKYRAVPADSVG